jgi:hypothetical protein
MVRLSIAGGSEILDSAAAAVDKTKAAARTINAAIFMSNSTATGTIQ